MREEMAMRALSLLFAGLAVTIILIPPATAAVGKKPIMEQTVAERRARWKALTSYTDCTQMVMENSWTPVEAWYICNARGFKK
jgi:hypothetical protein